MIISPASGFRGRSFRSVVGPLVNTADVDRSSYTYVMKFLPGALAANGSTIRLIVQGPVAAGHIGTLSNTYIGLVSTTTGANAYDFDGSQVAVTFAGGSSSVALTAGQLRTSDEINFSIDRSKAVLIAFNVAASSFISYTLAVNTNFIAYAKAAVSQASTTSKDVGYVGVGSDSTIVYSLEAV
jgi:hypothetical protein